MAARFSLAVVPLVPLALVACLTPAAATPDGTNSELHGGTMLHVDGLPENIKFEIERDGTILWNGEAVSCPEANARFRALAHRLGTRPVDMLPCEKYPEPKTPDKPK